MQKHLRLSFSFKEGLTRWLGLLADRGVCCLQGRACQGTYACCPGPGWPQQLEPALPEAGAQ